MGQTGVERDRALIPCGSGREGPEEIFERWYLGLSMSSTYETYQRQQRQQRRPVAER